MPHHKGGSINRNREHNGLWVFRMTNIYQYLPPNDIYKTDIKLIVGLSRRHVHVAKSGACTLVTPITQTYFKPTGPLRQTVYVLIDGVWHQSGHNHTLTYSSAVNYAPYLDEIEQCPQADCKQSRIPQTPDLRAKLVTKYFTVLPYLIFIHFFVVRGNWRDRFANGGFR